MAEEKTPSSEEKASAPVPTRQQESSKQDAPEKQQDEPQERTKEQRKLDEQGQHVVEGSDESLEKGYWGVRPTEIDDAEYSLATGPDAPYDDELGAV